MSSSSRPNDHSNCSEDCLLYQEIHMRVTHDSTLEVIDAKGDENWSSTGRM